MLLKIFKAKKHLLSSLQSCLHLNRNLMRLHFCLNHLAQQNKQYKMNVVLFIFQIVTRYTRILLQTFVRMQLVSRNVNCDSLFLKGTFHQKTKRVTLPSWCNVLCSNLFLNPIIYSNLLIKVTK